MSPAIDASRCKLRTCDATRSWIVLQVRSDRLQMSAETSGTTHNKKKHDERTAQNNEEKVVHKLYPAFEVYLHKLLLSQRITRKHNCKVVYDQQTRSTLRKNSHTQNRRKFKDKTFANKNVRRQFRDRVQFMRSKTPHNTKRNTLQKKNATKTKQIDDEAITPRPPDN